MAGKRPLVMGVLNVTPDSFSDGGRYKALDAALGHAETLIAQGVDIVDVGGESTRPGADFVGVAEELDRVVPVIDAIASRFDVRVSVDTSKPEVMLASVASGATLINDVRALSAKGALEAAVAANVDVCLMHMQGAPSSMQNNPTYIDVVDEVVKFLAARIAVCLEVGIDKSQLIVDPGFGFGKSLEHNYQMLGRIGCFKGLEVPILIGVSRKSMLGVLINRSPEDRLAAGLAAAAIAVWQGASIVRTHDVAETVDVLKICLAARAGREIEW